ncbi:hypothetical protein BDV23DRAFT_144567 [Aspergillus alliaceus]|uniref:Uncharacterized protein n=1 Tax=Petromyces alliaceus TaxID=209559 RepID=A0A5N7CNK6_PETAA|nr:hypothetical protein BDV23DRAFT_144567 [Aspergillus alliaceus]
MRHDSMFFGFIAHDGYDQHIWRWHMVFYFGFWVAVEGRLSILCIFVHRDNIYL